MKKIFFLALILCNALMAQAQQTQTTQLGCGSEPSKEFLDYLDAVPFGQRALRPRAEATYNIPISIKVLVPLGGSISTASYLESAYRMVCLLNRDYAGTSIQFYHKFYPTAVETSYSTVTSEFFAQAIEQNFNQPNVLNVYIADLSQYSGAGFAICGFARFPGSGSAPPGGGINSRGSMFIGLSGCLTNNTASHEAGHYFGLLHPHQTTDQAPAAAGAERVLRVAVPGKNAPNCTTAGDRLCDTQADFIGGTPPAGTGWSNCNSVSGTLRDINNDRFRPDSSLIMSYAPSNCTNRFSAQQLSQMEFTLTLPLTNGLTRQYLTANNPNPPVGGNVVLPSTTILPANNDSVSSNLVVFRWKSVPLATHYFMQISNRNVFSTASKVLDTIIVADTSFTFNGQFAAGTQYTWRVRPMNQASSCLYNVAASRFRATINIGVEELKSKYIKIYPTLIQNETNIRLFLDQLDANKMQVDLLDMTGSLVQSQQYVNIFNGQTLDFALGNGLANGVYNIRMQTDKQVLNKKIVVNR